MDLSMASSGSEAQEHQHGPLPQTPQWPQVVAQLKDINIASRATQTINTNIALSTEGPTFINEASDSDLVHRHPHGLQCCILFFKISHVEQYLSYSVHNDRYFICKFSLSSMPSVHCFCLYSSEIDKWCNRKCYILNWPLTLTNSIFV